MVRPRVFLDFSVDDSPVGRAIFELFNDSAPKTSENFRALCTGEKGLSPVSQKPLYFKNSIIHRSISNFMVQGGDFTKRNGTGGESIYGGQFPDEDLSRPLDSPGLLVMANKGPNTNGSQFFITLRDCPHLNGKHVVFGRALRGFDDVVQKIAGVPTDEKDRPTVPVVIANCGELELRKPHSKPVPEPSGSSSESGESQGRARKHRSKRRHRSRSRTPASGHDSEDGKSRHKKRSKHRRHEQRKEEEVQGPPSPHANDANPNAPREETEEEYDARLEREENERIELARKRDLEEIKRRYEASAQNPSGIRFKGRGRMKYIDPETRAAREDHS